MFDLEPTPGTVWADLEFLIEPTVLLTKHGFDVADVVVFLGGVFVSKFMAYGGAVRACCYYRPCHRFLTGTSAGRALTARVKDRHPYFVDWLDAKSQQWAERALRKKARRREFFRRFVPETSALAAARHAEELQRDPLHGGGGSTATLELHQAAEIARRGDPEQLAAVKESGQHIAVGMVEAICVFKMLWPFWFPLHMLMTFRLYTYLNKERLEKQKIEMKKRLALDKNSSDKDTKTALLEQDPKNCLVFSK
eukprot:g8002.t1